MIDLSFLNRMMNGDEKLVGRFLHIFKEQSPQQIQELRSQIDMQDWEAVSNTAHSLKSQFTYLNLHTLAERAGEIEMMADEKQTEQIKSLLCEVEVLFAELFEKELSV